MHGAHGDLLALLLLLAGSFFMPLVSGRLRVPSAVLLIGYGVVVGPHALHLVSDLGVVRFLNEVGFIVLMFLAGLEIDFNGVRRRGRRALLAVVGICVTVFVLAFLASGWLGLHPIYGLAVGATSVGLPLAVLKETGLLRTRLGQNVIVVGSVGEFFTVVGMTLFYFAVRYGLSLKLLVAMGKLVGMLALAGLTLRFLMALAWWHPSRFSRLVDEHDASEVGVRASLLMMMVFSVLAVFAGLESVVGAFVAGALMAFVLRGKEVLEEKLSVVGHGLFVPIFFIVVGLRFDPHAVTGTTLALAGKLLLATFAIRVAPSLVLHRFGLTLREAVATASLLSAPLTLVVAISAIGLELGVLGHGGRGTLIVLAVLAGVVFPVAFRLVAPGRSGHPIPQ